MTAHEAKHQWRDYQEHRHRQHKLTGAPSPGRDRVTDRRSHDHAAERLPAHHDPSATPRRSPNQLETTSAVGTKVERPSPRPSSA